MKYLVEFLYFIFTWSVVGFFNFCIFIYHFDFKHFNPYGYYFCTCKELRHLEKEHEENMKNGILPRYSISHSRMPKCKLPKEKNNSGPPDYR